MNERNRKYFILIATLIFIFSFSVALAVEEEPETIGLTLAEKINSFYNWALAIGGIIALGIIVFAGILYITSAGNPGRLSEAKAWITAALVGLLILFGSFLILKTLNPKLTNLEDIVLKINPEVEITLTTGDPQAVCSTHTECALACASFDCYPGGSCDTSSIEPWPGIAQFGDTVAVSDLNIPGVSAAGARILPGLKAPLEAAGSIAIGRGDGLYITGGWRSLTTQFLFACADLGRVPTYVAWPGSSNHGQGIAVDISLTGGPAHGSATYCRELAEIMYAAGWTRYTKEFWHFEYYADPAQRNTGNRSTSVYDCAGG